MITNSNNNMRDSKEQDFLNEDDFDRKIRKEESDEKPSSEDHDSREEQEVEENQEEQSLDNKADNIQKPENIDEADEENIDESDEEIKAENIDEADEEIKAALVAGTSPDEDIKAKAEEKHETSSVEKGDENSVSDERDDEAEVYGPITNNDKVQYVEMEEMVSVEEMDDIGQTEEEYAKEEEKEEDEEVDYSSFTKDQLVKAAEDLLNEENIKKADSSLKELKNHFEEIYSGEKKLALEKFIGEGGTEDDFNYKGDDLDARFESVVRTIKEKKDRFMADMEKTREQNLAAKNLVLEKLRKLVDAEENTASITELKEIQNEWRSIGPVPSQYVRSLWANYSALIDRFYDNRSIYFELKELDRRKNLEAKIDICERAEKLEKMDNLKEAIKDLNDLHEEFKHVGPAPREEQEALWKRFKAASDRIYTRRKEFVENLKSNLMQNYEEKLKLGEEVQAFVDFDSDKISEWNARTKEILDIQRKWETIGGLPREHARDVNKLFWSAFKKFFNNKSNFFKRLEGQREENLRIKEELVNRAEAIKESDNWEKTANELKELQKEWKNVGPVPEKVRNDIYLRFKKACDDFFNRKRSIDKETEKDYVDNLRQKEDICSQIEKLAEEKSNDVEKVEGLMDDYNSIGFVPRNSIKNIQKRFIKAVERFAHNASELSAEDRKDMVLAAQYQKLRSSPNANKRLQRKENSIKRQIVELENDISLWKNNVEFFANSASADKLRAEFNEKIAKARKELNELKQQLKVIRTI
jgi:hypothetical protein